MQVPLVCMCVCTSVFVCACNICVCARMHAYVYHCMCISVFVCAYVGMCHDMWMRMHARVCYCSYEYFHD